MTAARVAADTATAQLVRPETGFLGTAAGKSLDGPGEAAVIVYIDKARPGLTVPRLIHGLRTLVIPTDASSVSAGVEPATLTQVEGIHLPAEVLKAAGQVQRAFAPGLMADPAFFGVGVHPES